MTKLIIQDLFSVKVVSVNTFVLPAKKRRLGKFLGFKNSYKRTYITLVRLYN